MSPRVSAESPRLGFWENWGIFALFGCNCNLRSGQVRPPGESRLYGGARVGTQERGCHCPLERILWVRIGCRKCGYLPRVAASRHSKLLKPCSGGGSETTRTQEVEGSNPFVSTTFPLRPLQPSVSKGFSRKPTSKFLGKLGHF